MGSTNVSLGAIEKSTLLDLMYLQISEGYGIRIIEDSAQSYHCIGNHLLNGNSGTRVDNIEENQKGKQENIIYEIYKQWMREDQNHSWTKLTKCFRVCKLNSLAYDIEQHFGIPSPPESNDQRGIQCM